MDNYLQTGPELTALRGTSFYTQLRPYVKQRAAQRGIAVDFLVRDNDDSKLAPADRFYFGLDFILTDLFRNVRSRRWIKTSLHAMTEADHVDEVGAHFLYREYRAELVVVMERLQRLILLVEEGLDIPVTHWEIEVLQFFNPRIAEKRNHNHHGLYLGYPCSHEVEGLSRLGQTAEALSQFRTVMAREIAWMDYTEEAFAGFLSGFLDRVHQQLATGDGYVEPTKLPANFRLNSRLKGELRKKHKHRDVFREANGR